MSNLHLDDNKIIKLHNEKFSASQIALKMKCSKTTILNHLRKIKLSNDNDNNTINNKKINHIKKNILL